MHDSMERKATQMKRIMKVQLAAVAVSGLLLAGCSSSDEPDATSAMTSGTDGGTMAAGCEAYEAYGMQEGAELELYGTIQGVEADAIQTSVAEFERCTGATVTYNGSDQFETEINIRVDGGNPPDLAIFPQPGLLGRVVGTGAIVAAPASVEANVDEFWSADWKNYGTVGTTFYAAPLMASVKGYIWYSPAEFAANDYTVPTTWADMMDLTATMAANGGTGPNYKPWCIGFESGTATGWAGTDWIEDIVLRQQGADAYDQWVAGDLDFTSPEIKEAFEAFGAIALNNDYVNGGLGDSSSIANTPFGEGGLPIIDGSCSLHHQASFYSSFWPEGTTVAPDGDIWAFVAPPMAEGDPAAVTGGGEFVGAFNSDPATVALQTFLSSDTWANERVSLGGVISANKGLDSNNASSELLKGAIETLQGADTVFRFDASDLMPAEVGASSFWTQITNYVNGTPLDTVLSDIESSWP